MSSYHEAELAIALDRNHPAHYLPQLPGYCPTDNVLDVGCGRGQILLALKIPTENGFGVDPDAEAVSKPFGQHTLIHGYAEHLPFDSSFFQFVYSRVSLLYTNIPRALEEFHRVLKPGGQVWLSLNSWDFLKVSTKPSIKGVVHSAYVAVNSLALHFGFQFPFLNGRYESIQSPSSITKALRSAGFENIHIEWGKFFIVTANKPVAKLGS